jgi:hypothetical protein
LKITPPNNEESNSKIFSGSQHQRSSQNMDIGDIFNKLSEKKAFEATAKSVVIKKGIMSSDS